jgi:hypothetical protein
MPIALSYASSFQLRRRHAPRRSAKLEIAFAQIGMALARRAVPRDDAAAPAGPCEEPSVVDCLLGRCCQHK